MELEFSVIRMEFRVMYRGGHCGLFDSAQQALEYINNALDKTSNYRNDYSIQSRFVQATEWK